VRGGGQIRRDKANYRLRLDRLDDLPREVMKVRSSLEFCDLIDLTLLERCSTECMGWCRQDDRSV
jgi:hypothetical protein